MKNKYLLNSHTYYILFIVCTLSIITLLLLPLRVFSSTSTIALFKHSDKVVHFIMFFGETWLLFRCIEFITKYNFKKIGYIVFVSVFLFGFLTEILQKITYNTAKRTFSIWDLFFDTLACVVAIVLINILACKIKSRRFF